MTIKTESIDRNSIIPVPIRVHAGPSKRGRKLSDYKRSLLAAAVQEVRDRRRNGDLVSVREIAEFHGVAKSTLHRYLRPDERELSPPPRAIPNKLSIDFLIDDTNTNVLHNNPNNLNLLRPPSLAIKCHTLPFIASPTDVKREVVAPQHSQLNPHSIHLDHDN